MVVQNRRTGTSPVPTSEITIESNPGTADKAKLKALRELGINRLSIGVQSFNNRHLKTLGRIHSAEEALNFCADARAAGFDNINLDLIFALPNQTFEEWKSDLETAINLQPDHLSTYNLQIEENTPLWEKVNMPSPTNSKPSPLSRRERVLPNFQKHSSFSLWEKGESLTPVDEGFNIPSEDEELKMYEYTIETLTAKGYKHYEISNFAKSGFECQHNVNYWKNGNYLGLGAGAHSHLNGKRWSNPNCIEAYVAGRGTSTSSVESSRVAGQKLETGDPRQEALFLGLRLLEGLPSEKFAGFEKEVDELFKEGLLTQENNHYKLTRRGLYLGNLVFERFV
jgi:oxygen-independent coproporphyrinogen-3 oxidase